MFGDIVPPLSASVRLPIRVLHIKVSARMSSAMEYSLRFRGTLVAVVRAMRSGVQAVTVVASSCLGAGCVNRQRLADHQVPRSRSSSGRRPGGLARPVLSSCSSVRVGGVCRWRRGHAAGPVHSHRCPSFEASRSATQSLYVRDQSAYGVGNMRQLRFNFEPQQSLSMCDLCG